MKRKYSNMITRQSAVLLPSAVFLTTLVIWEVVVKLTHTPLYVLPPPSAVIRAVVSDYQNLVRHGLVTLAETVSGLVLAVIFGMLLAILMDAFGLLKKAVFPLLVISQTIPIIVLAPILIIYMGFGVAPKILTVTLMCFFPIAINLADAMSAVDQNQVNLVRSFGAGPCQVYRLVKIPASSPALFSGMQVAATYSVTGAVVGEWLAAESGLGYYMLRLKNGYMLDKVFACVVMVVLLSLLMNGAVKLIRYAIIERKKKMKKRLIAVMLMLSLAAAGMAGCADPATEGEDAQGEGQSDSLTPVTIILDYIPNTNHTGMYIAKDKGYYKELGLDVTIIEPTEGTASTLVATGKGDFGITFQEDVLYAKTSADPLPIKAIAAIIQHNTSGFVSYKEKNINSPKDFEGKTYSGWGAPSEEAVIKAVMTKVGADFSKVKIVTAGQSGYEILKDKVDFQWYFYAWDYLMAEMAGVSLNYIELRELDERLDYYTPVIVTSDQLIAEKPEMIRSFLEATKKGYEYAVANADDAAVILHQNADSYDLDMLKKSQAYLAEKYIDDAPSWGLMKDEVWIRYADFMKEYGLIGQTVPPEVCYTNEFLQ